MKEAKYFKKLSGKKVKCTACEIGCELDDGGIGVCGVRQNKDGVLYSLVYGNAVSVHLDPIEKKPLYHFLPGTEILSIGTIGCNFGCGFCQNWDISQVSKNLRDKLLKEGKADELGVEVSRFGYDLQPEKVVEYCARRKIPSIAYTYNEPTVFLEYALDTAKIAGDKGIKNVFVTNGYMSEYVLVDVAKHIDAANIDLKAFTEEFYQKNCKGRLSPVLRNIEKLHKLGVWIELTTLLIPGENDSSSELKKIAKFIADIDKDIPWHISRFHPDFEMTDVAPTTFESLKEAYDIGKKAGLHYVYLGNVIDSDRSQTVCPKCDKPLVNRNIYDVMVTEFLDSDGRCENCDQKIAGIWK